MTKDEVLALMIDDVASRSQKIAAFLNDETNSFEDRKEVFMMTPEHLFTKHIWVIHFTNFEAKYGRVSWYEDFYIARHEVVDLIQMIQDIESGEQCEDWDEEKKAVFIKDIVDQGIHAFEMDW